MVHDRVVEYPNRRKSTVWRWELLHPCEAFRWPRFWAYVLMVVFDKELVLLCPTGSMKGLLLRQLAASKPFPHVSTFAGSQLYLADALTYTQCEKTGEHIEMSNGKNGAYI